MHKNIFTLLLSLLITYLIFPGFLKGQEYKPKRDHIKGTIILKDSTVLEGYIKKSLMNNSQRIIYFSMDGEKKKYAPSHVARFSMGIDYISALSCFMEILFEGDEVSVYRYEKTNWMSSSIPTAGGMYSIPFPMETTKYYVKKNSQLKPKEVKKKKFKVVFAEYFKDCPEVAKKIATKEYRRLDIRRIAQEYDSCITD